MAENNTVLVFRHPIRPRSAYHKERDFAMAFLCQITCHWQESMQLVPTFVVKGYAAPAEAQNDSQSSP
jgi:hypothetical protein